MTGPLFSAALSIIPQNPQPFLFDHDPSSHFRRGSHLRPSMLTSTASDIGYWFPPKDIYGFLKEAWAIPLSRGTKVLALTVPECKSQSQLATDTRNELNRLILQHKEPNLYVYRNPASFPSLDSWPT